MKIVKTADGSTSIFREDLNEHYHSVHGAQTESMHVFIEAGLKSLPQNPLHVFEMGFGTGLNCLLTWIHRSDRTIFYTGVETFPLGEEIIQQLEFPVLVNEKFRSVFLKMHEAEWNHQVEVGKNFFLEKRDISLLEMKDEARYDLIYFDAFAPEKQPELWTMEVFRKMFNALKPGGILVTYCAKGYVKRNMKAAGFEVEKLPGPPGKREMTRGRKNYEL